MEQTTQKKGMSKGCMIALIVGVVLVVMVIVAGVTCYMKREDMAKFGAVTLVQGVKEMVAKEAPEGIDTVKFNGVADAFVEKLNAEPFDGEKFTAFFSTIQTVPTDSKVDSLEAEMLLEAMYTYYPELEELYPAEEPIDTLDVEESM